jgi:hypothetical protein
MIQIGSVVRHKDHRQLAKVRRWYEERPGGAAILDRPLEGYTAWPVAALEEVPESKQNEYQWAEFGPSEFALGKELE